MFEDSVKEIDLGTERREDCVYETINLRQGIKLAALKIPNCSTSSDALVVIREFTEHDLCVDRHGA